MRHSGHLILSFAIAACGHSPAGAPAACPSQDFLEFMEAFSESTEVQRAFTRFPLERQHLEVSAEPEPRPLVRKLGRDQVELPVLPNKDERKAKSLGLRVEKLASTQAQVVLEKSDTDYRVSYFFSRAACWELERIEDGSL